MTHLETWVEYFYVVVIELSLYGTVIYFLLLKLTISSFSSCFSFFMIKYNQNFSFYYPEYNKFNFCKVIHYSDTVFFLIYLMESCQCRRGCWGGGGLWGNLPPTIVKRPQILTCTNNHKMYQSRGKLVKFLEKCTMRVEYFR